MSATLSSSNRSQLSYRLEGPYPQNFGVPQTGTSTNLAMLSETMDLTIKNDQSKAIRADRSVADLVQVGATSGGGFAYEAQYREYDPFILAALQCDTYTAYGTDGLSTASAGTLTVTSATVLTASVAATGADALTSMVAGQWITIIPSGVSAVVAAYFARRPVRLASVPTSTVITLDAITPLDLTVVGLAAGTVLPAGYQISSAVAMNSNVMKSYTIEVGHADISRYRQFTGQVVSKMDVKLAVGSIVNGSFEFMGKFMNLNTTANAPTGASPTVSQTFTPANATKGVFDILEGGQSISVSTFIKSGEFTIDNTLRIQDAIGVFGAAGIGAGTFNPTGKIEVYFADSVMYNKFLNGTASSLTIPLLDVNGNGYVYYFPRIKYSAAKVSVGGLDQDNMISLDWQGTPDQNAGPTFGKAVVIYRVGAAVSGTVVVVTDTRPRFVSAVSNSALVTGTYTNVAAGTLFASMTPLTGGVNGGHAGTMSLTTPTGQYGWLACVKANVGAGVHFQDSVGFGGWSGAGLAGNNSSGNSPDPSTVHVEYTDANNVVWNIYRMDYSGGYTTASTITVS